MQTDQRKIVGFMGAAVVFSLVGDVEKSKTQSVPSGSYVKIIVGGTLAAGLLALLAEAGEGGAKLAVGLSGITLIASILFNGAHVFSGVSKATGTLKTMTPTITTSKTKVTP